MRRHRLAFFAAASLTLAAAPALSAEPSPIAEGKTQFEQKCATCHTLERSLAVRYSREEWDANIKRMVSKGAAVDKAQAELIIGYLTTKAAFETRCNGCHALDRPLTAIKKPEEWRSTVLRMSGMKAGLLTDAEAGAIALYLSLVAPAPAAK